MSDSICISCRKPKATLTCGLCENSVCKKCVQTLDSESFSFLPVIPEALHHLYYCGACYDQTVAPEQEKYNETMERAKGCFIFFTTQKKEIPLLKKAKQAVFVPDCPDRNETILRLAFFAAQEDYNAVVNVEVKSEKIRNESYQKSKWSGSGTPAVVDGAKLDRMDLERQMYGW